MKEEEIPFTREKLFELLKDYYNFLIEDGIVKDKPLTEGYEQKALLLNDYVDGYFESYFQPERSKREDSCKHELYPQEFKEDREGYIYMKCKKCDEKLYAECL